MAILVAPTEPPLLQALGQVSLTTENMGVDLLWSAHRKTFGIQRKTPTDFLQSLDGRLNDELDKAGALSVSMLLFEGAWTWTRDGKYTGRQQFTKKQLWAFCASVQARGHWLAFTDSTEDTVAYVEAMYAWSLKDKHTALTNAPKVKSAWGGKVEPIDRKVWALRVLCPGVGDEMARRLIEANDGKVPLALTMDADALVKVPGWGPKRVKALLDALS